MVEKIGKFYRENQRAFAIGGAIMATAASAMFLYKRRQIGGMHKWCDPHFTSENLTLYSEEANLRAA